MQPIDQKALITLKAHRDRLTWQQYKTLRGQVLSGNAEGAMKGLKRLVGKQEAKHA